MSRESVAKIGLDKAEARLKKMMIWLDNWLNYLKMHFLVPICLLAA